MDDSPLELVQKSPEEQLQEIEALLVKWQNATDVESLWALSLLRHTAEQIRNELATSSRQAKGKT